MDAFADRELQNVKDEAMYDECDVRDDEAAELAYLDELNNRQLDDFEDEDWNFADADGEDFDWGF